jgi:EAL domain-containing protein (putative c-di-GMP-specific phosphodiesterase class I)
MRQLALPNFVNMVREILQETGLPARYLSLEVTESILMTDAATKISYLEALRDVGVAISLDDFGTGYSSFTYLAQMPITTLKIDKSMVDDIAQRGNSRNLLLLEALLQLSVLLGYRVVAEGVETREQLNLLKSKGCGFCQGYLLGRPMPEAAVLAMGGQQTK